MMKALLRMCVLMVLCLSACQQPEAQTKQGEANTQAASTPNQTVYTVATDATYPPFEFTNERGDIIGLDIDLLNAIAEDQGFKVRYYHHVWEGMFEELQGKADILASAIAITEESKQAADLSHHYYVSPYLKASLDKNMLASWKKQRISASRNEDTIEDLLGEYGVAQNHIVPNDTLYLAMAALVKKQADVVVGDATVLKYYIKSPTFDGYHFESETLPSADPETDKLVFAVSKGNTDLLNKINKGLENLQKNGQLAQILQKWRQD